MGGTGLEESASGVRRDQRIGVALGIALAAGVLMTVWRTEWRMRAWLDRMPGFR